MANLVPRCTEFESIQAQNLLPAFLWIRQYNKLWDERVDSFEAYLETLKTNPDKDGRPEQQNPDD